MLGSSLLLPGPPRIRQYSVGILLNNIHLNIIFATGLADLIFRAQCTILMALLSF